MSDDEPSSTEVHATPDGGRARGPKFSEILRDIADDPERERVSVADLLDAMGDRAFGALMLVFALPNVLPAPPGTSGILGVPLVFLAAQLMLGRKPWLPGVVANRSMLRSSFRAPIDKAAPWLARAEKLLRPRLNTLTEPPAEYLIGALCLVLAIIIVLPIPMGNMPPAFAICLLSLGILERDGLWVIAGFIAAAASIVVIGGIAFALLKGAVFIITNMFN